MSVARERERRRIIRKKKRISALIGLRGKGPRGRENAVIEDYSGTGMRVRSGTPLALHDSVVVYDLQGLPRFNAKVVWARKEGVIEKRVSGRPGQAVLAGCRIRETNSAPEGKRGRSSAAAAVFSFSPARVAAVAAALGFLATAGYILLTLLSMW